MLSIVVVMMIIMTVMMIIVIVATISIIILINNDNNINGNNKNIPIYQRTMRVNLKNLKHVRTYLCTEHYRYTRLVC